MQIISNIALISINETLVVQLISFLVFLFVINRLMFRPLRSVMAEREEFIDGLRGDIKGTEQEMADMLAQLEKQEAEVKTEAIMYQKKLKEEGNEISERIHEEAFDKMTQLRHKTEKEVQAQIDEARKHLARESEALAVRIMEKVLDRRLA